MRLMSLMCLVPVACEMNLSALALDARVSGVQESSCSDTCRALGGNVGSAFKKATKHSLEKDTPNSRATGRLSERDRRRKRAWIAREDSTSRLHERLDSERTPFCFEMRHRL